MLFFFFLKMQLRVFFFLKILHYCATAITFNSKVVILNARFAFSIPVYMTQTSFVEMSMGALGTLQERKSLRQKRRRRTLCRHFDMFLELVKCYLTRLSASKKSSVGVIGAVLIVVDVVSLLLLSCCHSQLSSLVLPGRPPRKNGFCLACF